MSLKINVIYKGIIYRVKGIKVICSVVFAVIVLLLAIVGMGVWMLINVYDEEMTSAFTSNSSAVVNVTSPQVAPSIEFGKSEGMASQQESFADESTNQHNRKKLEPDKSDLTPQVAPEAELYGAAFYKPGRKDSYVRNSESFSENDRIDIINDQSEFNNAFGDNTRSELSWKEEVERIKQLPPRLIPKNINTAILSDDTNYSQNWNPLKIHDLQNPSYDYNENKQYSQPLETRQEKRPLGNIAKQPSLERDKLVSALPRQPTRVPTVTTTQFSRRSGLPLKNKFTYIGPPVVGYGSNPYGILTQERIKEYDKFWRAYAGKKAENSPEEIRDKFMREDAIEYMRPHLRGLRPSEVKYDLPVRPDAQLPSKLNEPTDTSSFQASSSKDEQRPPLPSDHWHPYPHPIPDPTRKLSSPGIDPDRKLLVEDVESQQVNHQMPSTRPDPPSNPLQELYDYSKKLAASLLSFNSKSANEVQNSAEKLAEYGVNLIETHNHVFKHPVGGPLDRIVALIPSANRLKLLDPFELSLVTWTFLDFWEFLIDKVGTLSDEDLSLLRERLEKLRRRKDNTMTKVFVNETLTRYSPNKQRSISHNNMNSTNQNNAHLMNHKMKEEVSNEDFPTPTQQVPKKESSPTLQVPASYSQILGNLFPSFVNLNINNRRGQVNKMNSSVDINNNDQNDNKGAPANSTVRVLVSLLDSPDEEETPVKDPGSERSLTVEGRSAWDPLGLFTSEARMQFMQFAVKVVFNFGKVYLKKPYALDCSMLLFCKDLNKDSNRGGLEAMAAKLKSVGLKVLTETEQELRESDTFGQVWRSVTAWTPMQCDSMFPRCDGPKALEIVNEVAMGGIQQ